MTYSQLKLYNTNVDGMPTRCSNDLQKRVQAWRKSHKLPERGINIFNADTCIDYACEDCIFAGRLANLFTRYDKLAIQVSHLYYFPEAGAWYSLFLEGEEDIPLPVEVPEEHINLFQESFLAITGKSDAILAALLGVAEKTIRSWYSGSVLIPEAVIRELARVYLTNSTPEEIVRKQTEPKQQKCRK